MTQKVTKRQQAVLDCIEACIREKGYGPTVREVCQSLGLSSPSTVHVHLKALEDKGFIKRDPLKSRSIALTYPIEEVPSPVTAFAAAYSKLVNVPLVGNVAAGSPILAEENITDTITLPTDIVGDAPSFMLSVRGESMIEAGINDGDYVVVKEQPVANNGDIVVAIIDDDERIVPEFIAAYIAFFDAHPSVASAGGPIVEPTARNLLLTPICPHSTRSSSYVLSPEHVITVEAPDANRKFVYLSVDGGKAFSLKNNDQVRVSTSKYTTRLVRLSKKSFCEILDKKMGGEVTKA